MENTTNYIIYIIFQNGERVQVATARDENDAKHIVEKLNNALNYSADGMPMAFFIKNDDINSDFVKKIELHI